MGKITLVIPTSEHRAQATAFKKAFFDAGEDTIDGSELLDRWDCYEDWIAYINDNSNPETVRPKCVLTNTYFVFDESGKMVGIIDYRHELNDFFKDFGHCGYSVLPSERRKGYATEMLRQVLDIARADGLKTFQLCALRSNIPSVKTIMKNGGKLTRSFDFHGNIADVFIIEL